MFFGGWGFNVSTQAISALLEKPETTVEEALLEPTLSTAIRTSLPALVTFITQPVHMNTLFDWILTKKHENEENARKITRMALQCLSGSSSNLMSAVMISSVYRERMNNFLVSEERRDAKLCGHFMRLFDQMAHFTRGELIRDFPNFLDWVIDNMTCIGVKELCAKLICDYPQIFDPDNSLPLKLAQASYGPNGMMALLCILEIFHNKPDFMKNFKDEAIVSELLNAVVNQETSNNAKCTALRIIQKITIDASSKFIIPLSIIDDYSAKFEAIQAPPDFVCSYAYHILKTDNPEKLLRIFDPNTPPLYRQAMFYQFMRLDQDKLEEMNNQYDLLGKIMEEEPKQKMNVSILLLANYIRSTGMDKEGWKEFLIQAISRFNDLNKPYAGYKCDSSSSSSEAPPEADNLFSSDDDYSGSDEIAPPPQNTSNFPIKKSGPCDIPQGISSSEDSESEDEEEDIEYDPDDGMIFCSPEEEKKEEKEDNQENPNEDQAAAPQED